MVLNLLLWTSTEIVRGVGNHIDVLNDHKSDVTKSQHFASADRSQNLNKKRTMFKIGKKVFPNKSKYEGEMINDLPHGKGKIINK